VGNVAVPASPQTNSNEPGLHPRVVFVSGVQGVAVVAAGRQQYPYPFPVLYVTGSEHTSVGSIVLFGVSPSVQSYAFPVEHHAVYASSAQ
jgi:hypothetical protein